MQLYSIGLKIANKYKHLGIILGANTAEEMYGLALRKATEPTFSMQSWVLSLEERVELLQFWILPLLVYPARVIFPNENVISAVKTIYNIALKLNSWGITTYILSHPKDQGGMDLAPPNTFMPWQFSFLCAMYTKRRLFRSV